MYNTNLKACRPTKNPINCLEYVLLYFLMEKVSLY